LEAVEMNISEVTVRMIDFYKGNPHDINHFLKVYAYARTIGECEGLDADTQAALETAAVLHDIACPLCRGKYGSARGDYQEKEGPALAQKLLDGLELPSELVDRVLYLIAHHHTPEAAGGLDYQILLEADYLVNANECGFSQENIRHTLDTMFKTATGRALLRSVCQL